MNASQAWIAPNRHRFWQAALAVVLGIAALAWVHPAKAKAETTCTWGGTPAAPTGTFTITPGTTNVPSAGALKFVATGPLAGDDPRCRGPMKFDGRVDAGASCLLPVSFEGAVVGLPGVARWWGKGNFDVPSYLYDKAGNLVGVENAQILTQDNSSHYLDCSTPDGFTGGTFSSNVVLFN